MAAHKILGIDLGSRNVKICRMENGALVSQDMFETIEFYRVYGKRFDDGLRIDLAPFGHDPETALVATGYGRMSAAVKGARIISEIKAHSLGALHQTGLTDFTLLDMGGQDYKVIDVRNGAVRNFATNDKCAASTGRYLENMAKVLGMSLEELGLYSEKPAPLSGTCAIFGESELIGLIVQGTPLPELAAGVNRTIVQRILPLLDRMGEGSIVMSGGVALNTAVVSLLREMTGRDAVTVDDPLFNGAIGCCVQAAG
jgi:predicted CoA-substrate-specific enzyme activase